MFTLWSCVKGSSTRRAVSAPKDYRHQVSEGECLTIQVCIYQSEEPAGDEIFWNSSEQTTLFKTIATQRNDVTTQSHIQTRTALISEFVFVHS